MTPPGHIFPTAPNKQGTGGGQGGGGGQQPVSPKRQSAYDLLRATLQAWGLGSLYQDALGFLKQGLSQDEINLKLQDTPAWKQRFAGNEMRLKAGLPVLSPAEYLANEEQYRNVMDQYGIPHTAWDKNTTDRLIGGDVSSSELQQRVSDVANVVDGNPNVLKAWNQFYGGGRGGAIAAIFDPKTATPLLEQRTEAAQIGGEALGQGLATSRDRALKFARAGVSLDQARQAYQQIASNLPTDTALSSRFGTTVNQTTEENAALLGNAAAARKQSLLYSEESAQFGGHGAASAASNANSTSY